MLEGSEHFEEIYQNVILCGETAAPPAGEEVDLYYICFIKSADSSVYKMDRDTNGLVKTGVILGKDKNLLEMPALGYMQRYIARGGDNINFTLLALTKKTDDSN